jgi:hypothetical protein
MNLGAYFNYPEIKPNNLIGLAFEPLNIEKYFNRSRLTKPGDGKGWIDLGNRFDLDPLQPGVQSMNGVPFAIADESKTGGNSVIMLRSDEQFKNSARRKRHHPVGKKGQEPVLPANLGYANSKKGTTAWEYEIPLRRPQQADSRLQLRAVHRHRAGAARSRCRRLAGPSADSGRLDVQACRRQHEPLHAALGQPAPRHDD